MQRTPIELFKEIMKLPVGQRSVAFMVLLPFAIITFYESRDNYAKNRVKELEIALNVSEIKREEERNQYISSIKECDIEKSKIVTLLNGKLDEYKKMIEEREAVRTREIEQELKQLRRGVKQTDNILHRTIQLQKN